MFRAEQVSLLTSTTTKFRLAVDGWLLGLNWRGGAGCLGRRYQWGDYPPDHLTAVLKQAGLMLRELGVAVEGMAYPAVSRDVVRRE
jgi:hypothetical protein